MKFSTPESTRRLWRAISPREYERRRVHQDLDDLITEIAGFVGEARTMLDRKVLEWDFRVRSLLRRYFGPEALEGFARATLLKLDDASDADRSADALRRAEDSLSATIAAMEARSGIFTGGFTRAWLYRAVIQGGIVAFFSLLVAVLAAGLIWFFGFQGEGLSKQAITADGVERDIVRDSGEVVQVAPTPTTGPGPTPTVAATPLPTVSLPDEAVLDIPPDPEQHGPAPEAETLFNEGLRALKLQEFQTAVDKFSDAVEIEPGFVRAYYNLGLAQERLAVLDAERGDDVQAGANRRGAVESYTTAIDLWNSLGEEGDGLLFQAKLARGLLLINFASEREDICVGRLDLLDVLERGNPSPRNEEAINRALTQIEEDCESPQDDAQAP